MSILAALESTAFSEWVLSSMLGFPTLIALHSVGMAVAAGLSMMVALQLNGFLPGMAMGQTPGILRVATWGFILNFATGIAIFIPRGTEYIANVTFLVKMGLVLFSATILFWLIARLTTASEPCAGRTERTWSAICALGWAGGVVSGRLIAYVGQLY